MAKKLILLRHGETTWNAEGRLQGQIVSVPLNDIGKSQARVVATKLAYYEPVVIVSSDSDRAISTVDPLSDMLGLPIELDTDLRERDMSSWAGMLKKDCTGFPPKGWESSPRVAQRMVNSIFRITEKLPKNETAVVSSHGGTIKYGLEKLLDIDRSKLAVLRNGHWTTIQLYRKKWQIVEHNTGG